MQQIEEGADLVRTITNKLSYEISYPTKYPILRKPNSIIAKYVISPPRSLHSKNFRWDGEQRKTEQRDFQRFAA